jgi:hypothetical protein
LGDEAAAISGGRLLAFGWLFPHFDICNLHFAL